MIYKNQAALDRSLRLWQERLRMQDWDISVQVVRASTFGTFGMTGSCQPDIRNREVDISLLDPVDFDDGYLDAEYDMEETLVHELLHAKLAPVTRLLPEDTPDDEEETFVHQTAQSFVKAYRD